MTKHKLYMMELVSFQRTQHSYPEKGLLFNDGEIILDEYGKQPETIWNYTGSSDFQLQMSLDVFFGPYERVSEQDTQEDKVAVEIKQTPMWIDIFYDSRFTHMLYEKLHLKDLHPSISIETDAHTKGKYIEESVYLKTMSDGGQHDNIAADMIEQYLKANEIEYRRYDDRRFEIYGLQYVEHFLEDKTDANS